MTKIKGFNHPAIVGRKVYVRDLEFTVHSFKDDEVVLMGKHNVFYSFEFDGRYSKIESLPSLSYTPYTVEIKDGMVYLNGYSDELEIEEEKDETHLIGKFGYFWDSEIIRGCSCGYLDYIDLSSKYCYGKKEGIFYKNFSLEIPEHLRDNTPPKVGDVGYFWDDESVSAVYSELASISNEDEFKFETKDECTYQYFSKYPPKL